MVDCYFVWRKPSAFSPPSFVTSFRYSKGRATAGERHFFGKAQEKRCRCQAGISSAPLGDPRFSGFRKMNFGFRKIILLGERVCGRDRQLKDTLYPARPAFISGDTIMTERKMPLIDFTLRAGKARSLLPDIEWEIDCALSARGYPPL
jgi:hypothetical protein